MKIFQAACALLALGCPFAFSEVEWAPSLQSAVIGALLVTVAIDDVTGTKRKFFLAVGVALIAVSIGLLVVG